MARLRPDPTFYPSAKQAAEAPPEELAYLAMLSPQQSRPDAIGVVDVRPGSKSYGHLVGQLDMPNTGDELHHFGSRSTTGSSTCHAGGLASSGNTTFPIHSIRGSPPPPRSAASSAGAAHPANPNKRLNGGPQMVELSRDGRRVYLTNGLYSPWDEQFYPAGLESWMVKLDTRPEGGVALDSRFFLGMERDVRCHQVRLQSGDASSDSFCFSS